MKPNNTVLSHMAEGVLSRGSFFNWVLDTLERVEELPDKFDDIFSLYLAERGFDDCDWWRDNDDYYFKFSKGVQTGRYYLPNDNWIYALSDGVGWYPIDGWEIIRFLYNRMQHLKFPRLQMLAYKDGVVDEEYKRE